MNNDQASNKIIDATIKCIGEYGVQSVTNRLIAKEAGVNSAAINYYFSSKENLINEAIKRSLDNYFTEFLNTSLEKNEEQDIKQILEKFLTDTLRDSIETPYFIKSYFYEPFVNNNYNGIFVSRFNLFLSQLSDVADVSVLGNSEEEVKMSLLQIVSSLMFINLMPDFFKDFLNADIKDADTQKAFVDLLINKYCINK
jgi:AcrR family transcriptional regulator